MTPSKKQIAKFIASRIVEARERAGLTQEELGKAIDKTNVSVSDIERERVGVTAVDLALIAKELKQPLEYFYPTLATIRRKRDELNSRELRLVQSFENIDNVELENYILDFVEGIGRFAQKNEVRRTLDDLKWVVGAIKGTE